MVVSDRYGLYRGFNTSVIQQCGRIKNRPKGRGIKPACRNKELLKENIPIPIDFLAIDYNKYNKLKNATGYIYKTIEQEGEILYGE
ncbi:MAG: hypothetical protein LBK44_06585 [Spirochaetales bacterium]|nr:hypothetical protein [Spirochaetales bacterium]